MSDEVCSKCFHCERGEGSMLMCGLGDFPVLADSECLHDESQFTSTIDVAKGGDDAR